MTETIKIVISLVVILIAALVVLTIFSGGISGISDAINVLLGQVKDTTVPTCQSVNGICKTLATCNSEGGSINTFALCPGAGNVCCVGSSST